MGILYIAVYTDCCCYANTAKKLARILHFTSGPLPTCYNKPHAHAHTHNYTHKHTHTG